MERIWQYVYGDELKTLPEEHPVLLTGEELHVARQSLALSGQPTVQRELKFDRLGFEPSC